MRGYAQSREAMASLTGLVLGIVVCLLVHATRVRLYFDPQGASIRLGLLTPVVSVLAVHLSLGHPLGEMESVFGREMRRLRGVHVAVVVVVAGLGALLYAAAHGPGGPLGQFVRNSALLLGLLLAAAATIGSDHAWVVPLGLTLATYGFGLDPDLSQPRRWALLLQDTGAVGLGAALAVLALGCLLFVVSGPRGGLRQEGTDD